MKRSGSGVHIFELAFDHKVDILNTDFLVVLTSCHSHGRTLNSQSRLYLLDLSDLTKLVVAVADVDQFC